MRKYFLIATLLVAAFCQGGNIEVKQREVLNVMSGYYPVLSADGKELLYTSESYTGLVLMNLLSKQQRVVSSAAQAGYDARFSSTGSSIYYREMNVVSGKRFTNVVRYDKGNAQSGVVMSNLRGAISYAALPGSEMMLCSNRKLRVDGVSVARSAASVYACSEDLSLVVYQNGVRKELKPLQEDVAGYIWVSLSPSGDKILFTAAGSGSYVCDLNGKIVSSLGYLNAPVWYGNDYVVGMCDKDNGEEVTESTIVMRSLDGKVQQVLSAQGEIGMHPSASVQSGKVAYNTLNGKIVVLILDVK